MHTNQRIYRTFKLVGLKQIGQTGSFWCVISWRKHSLAPNDFKKYNIKVDEDGSVSPYFISFEDGNQNANIPDENLNITGLTPGTKYEISVQVENKLLQQSDWSSISIFTKELPGEEKSAIEKLTDRIVSQLDWIVSKL